MGCDTGQDNEKPVHRVWVDEFLLAAHQVTNADYGRFVRDTASSSSAAILERPRIQPSRAACCRSVVVRGGPLLRVAQRKHWRKNFACRPRPSGNARPAEDVRAALYPVGRCASAVVARLC